MILSPFSPVFFQNRKGIDGIPSKYVQVFAPTDVILLELIGTSDESEPTATVNNAITGNVLYSITWNFWNINDTDVLYFQTIKGLSDGYYTISIGTATSEPFRVTDDDTVLQQTTLLQYRNKDNKQRTDTVFIIDNMPYFFDFRVPGGIKDSGWSFGVDNEQFTTESSDIVNLFAIESTQKTLTVGNSIGCPIWFGELLNRLLCCSYVYLDGVRYARKEQNVPEINTQMEGLDSFIFTQMIQKVTALNPTIETENQVLLRRLTDNSYRKDSETDNTNLKIY